MRSFISFIFVFVAAVAAQAQTSSYQDALMECNYTLATQLLDKELQSVGADYQKLVQIGNGYRQCNQTVKAIRAYERALALQPEQTVLLRQLVRLEMLLGNYDKGIKYCHVMLEKDSLDAISFRLLGNCYYSKREFGNALLSYNKAYSINPEDFSTVDAFSSMLLEEHDYEGALQMTEKYREKDTTNLKINQNNAEAYFRLERYDKSIERYKALEKAGDHSFYTLYFQGVSHFAKKNYYAAHDYLEKARPTDPENVSLLYYLAVASAKTSWKDDAIKYMEQVEDLTIPSDSTLSWMYNGFTKVYPKRNPRYEEALLKLLDINPSRFALWNVLGQTFETTDNAKATKYYKRYIETVPENERSNYPISVHLDHAKRFLEGERRKEETEKFWKRK